MKLLVAPSTARCSMGADCPSRPGLHDAYPERNKLSACRLAEGNECACRSSYKPGRTSSKIFRLADQEMLDERFEAPFHGFFRLAAYDIEVTRSRAGRITARILAMPKIDGHPLVRLFNGDDIRALAVSSSSKIKVAGPASRWVSRR
jgi:hypothetical protein